MNENKIYVRVNADFDRDGFVHPRSIIWSNGREYEIDRVTAIKHMHASKAGGNGDRFTIRVSGRERYLFYERIPELEGNHVGRWFLEKS